MFGDSSGLMKKRAGAKPNVWYSLGKSLELICTVYHKAIKKGSYLAGIIGEVRRAITVTTKYYYTQAEYYETIPARYEHSSEIARQK